MKMTKKFVLLTIFCLAAAIGVTAQKQIDEKEYYRQFYAANEKSSTASRREISRDETYKNGKLEKTVDITDEFLPPDRRHYVYASKIGDKDSLKFELIQIGSTYYCRDGNKWRQAENWCANGSMFGGLSNIVSSEFTVEEAKPESRSAMLYQQYTVYKNTFVPEKPVLSYMKSKFWVNGDDGFLLREEREFGAVEPAKINRKIIRTYEYNANLKIEAPAGATKSKTR